MDSVHVSRTWIVTTGCYAAVVAALTWSWASGSGGFSAAEAATFVLLLPAAFVTLPVTYVVLASLWNLTGSSVSQGDVPTGITAAYSLWFALLAVLNAVVVTAGYRMLHARRSRVPRAVPVTDS